MAYYFSNLAQSLYFDLGVVDPLTGLFSATGGSTTTIINTNWGNLPDPPEEDFAKSYLALITRDAGGAGAAPEMEYSLVSAYVETSQTLTVGTITAVGAGDTIMLAPQDKYPIDIVLFAANRALQRLGDIVLPDTSLTSADAQTEYAVPLALKRRPPLAVYYQGSTSDSNDNQWVLVTNWRFASATAGTTGLLYLPQIPAGRTILLYYKGVHPLLTAYNSPIVETIHPEIISLATKIALYEWWNSQGNGEDIDVWKEATKWPQQLALAKAENPIWEPQPAANGFLIVDDGAHGSTSMGYGYP